MAQIDKEYFWTKENQESYINKEIKPCLLDSFISGKILACLCSFFPPIIKHILTQKIEKKSTGLILLNEDILFFEYLVK